MSELWLIGEAPTRANGPAFTGRAAERLSTWLDRDLHKTFRCANVLDRWPGESKGKGTKFPRQAAREGVERLFSQLKPNDQVIVVGGRNASNAWLLTSAAGLPDPYQWGMLGMRSKHNVPMKLRRVLICWIPHPSAVNQRWNDSNHIKELKEFIDGCIRKREEAGLGGDAP